MKKKLNPFFRYSRLNEIFDNHSYNSLIEISGDIESGKSQLAMFIAMQFANAEKRVLYLDGTLSFNRNLMFEWSSRLSNPDKSNLSNITIIELFDYKSLMDFIQEFHNTQTDHGCVLIIDELTTLALSNKLYNPENEKRSLSNIESLFDNVYYNLADIANRFNILTFMTRLQSDKITKKFGANLSDYEQIDGTIRIVESNENSWKIVWNNIYKQLSLDITI